MQHKCIEQELNQPNNERSVIEKEERAIKYLAERTQTNFQHDVNFVAQQASGCQCQHPQDDNCSSSLRFRQLFVGT